MWGGGKECDVRPSEHTVSENHARLTLEYGRITLEDLASTNGTRVNLRQIRKIELHDGDRIPSEARGSSSGSKPAPRRCALQAVPDSGVIEAAGR